MSNFTSDTIMHVSLIKDNVYKLSIIGHGVYYGKYLGDSRFTDLSLDSIPFYTGMLPSSFKVKEIFDDITVNTTLLKTKYKILNAPPSSNPEACFRTF